MGIGTTWYQSRYDLKDCQDVILQQPTVVINVGSVGGGVGGVGMDVDYTLPSPSTRLVNYPRAEPMNNCEL